MLRSMLGLMGLLLALSAGALGCGGEEATPSTQVRMEFAASDFYAAPWPSQHRLRADGTVDASGFPNPNSLQLVTDVVAQIDGRARGFGATSGVYFSLTAPLDEATLPMLHDSVTEGSAVIFLDAEPNSPDYLRRYPITTHYEAEAGLHGAPHLLSALPLQGIVPRPATLHAVALTSALSDSSGAPLAAGPELTALLAGERPAGLSEAAFDSYQRALSAVRAAGVADADLVGLAAFVTDDPVAEMVTLADTARALPLPAPTEAWVLADTFDSYCVFESRLDMPVYQSGEPPYDAEGGGIVWQGGVPQLDHQEAARIVVTVPRAAMPAGGYPTAVMVRTGGGGDRPLVDRGRRAEAGGEAEIPGTGPALYYASVGYAGVSVDGPHGGIRNISGGDEQFLVFNVSNPAALRDNLRQSALELALLPDIVGALQIDTSTCPGAAPMTQFDSQQMVLMGHSMGATIAPLTLAVEPRFHATVLSGAGGSYIANVIHKLSPVVIKPLAEVLLGYPSFGLSLHEHDPFLNMLQFAGEPADPPLYARRIVREPVAGEQPRHVLMLQGIVDTYILPPMANATSLSLGLDLAGASLDEPHPELTAFDPLAELLPYADRSTVTLPTAASTDPLALVVQHPEGPIEDGHEVMFQTEPPKHQYRCFMLGLLSGAPAVPLGAGELDSCD